MIDIFLMGMLMQLCTPIMFDLVLVDSSLHLDTH